MTDQYTKQLEKYRGSWVRLTLTNNHTRQGLIKHGDFNEILLMPVLVQETVGNKPEDLEIRLERNIPTTIFTKDVSIIEPLSQDYIDILLRTYPKKEKDGDQLELEYTKPK